MDRRLRQLVLERARFCCEYCQMPQVFSDAGHEMDHTIAISAGTPMAAPAGETGAWRGRSGRLTSSCPNTPWRPSRPSRCRIVQDFKQVRHGEPNDCVNRAESTASTETQNADAASVVPTPAIEDGGSGSTHCSFSYFLLEPLEQGFTEFTNE